MRNKSIGLLFTLFLFFSCASKKINNCLTLSEKFKPYVNQSISLKDIYEIYGQPYQVDVANKKEDQISFSYIATNQCDINTYTFQKSPSRNYKSGSLKNYLLFKRNVSHHPKRELSSSKE